MRPPLANRACLCRGFWRTQTSFSSPFRQTVGLLAAASLIEGLTLSAFQICSVPLSIWSGGILRLWRLRFFLVCRWLATNAAMSWRQRVGPGSRPLGLCGSGDFVSGRHDFTELIHRSQPLRKRRTAGQQNIPYSITSSVRMNAPESRSEGQLYGLAVRRSPVRFGPSFLSSVDRRAVSQTLNGNQALKCC